MKERYAGKYINERNTKDRKKGHYCESIEGKNSVLICVAIFCLSLKSYFFMSFINISLSFYVNYWPNLLLHTIVHGVVGRFQPETIYLWFKPCVLFLL